MGVVFFHTHSFGGQLGHGDVLIAQRKWFPLFGFWKAYCRHRKIYTCYKLDEFYVAICYVDDSPKLLCLYAFYMSCLCLVSLSDVYSMWSLSYCIWKAETKEKTVFDDFFELLKTAIFWDRLSSYKSKEIRVLCLVLSMRWFQVLSLFGIPSSIINPRALIYRKSEPQTAIPFLRSFMRNPFIKAWN